jgi:hypothetical protein
MATIGIVTVAHGDKYRAFLPEWAVAVASLQRIPDAITIVTDNVLCRDLATACDMLGPNCAAIETGTTFKTHPQILANEGIQKTHTDWICKLDADDLIYPHGILAVLRARGSHLPPDGHNRLPVPDARR